MKIKSVLTVFGLDRKGIIAAVTKELLAFDANVEDISQTITDGYFNMMMIIRLDEKSFDELHQSLQALGEELHVTIAMQREETFRAMHRI